MRSFTVLAFALGFAFAGAQAPKRIEDGSTYLLDRKDVQAELKLSEDQAKKIADEIHFQANREIQALADAVEHANERQDLADLRLAKNKLQPAHLATLKAILTDAQWQRLGELRVQLGGFDVLRFEAFQTVMPLTKAQIDQIAALDKQEYLRSVEFYRNAFQGGDLDKDAAFQFETENRAKTRKEIGKLLTPEQLEKFNKMGGAPFTPAKD